MRSTTSSVTTPLGVTVKANKHLSLAENQTKHRSERCSHNTALYAAAAVAATALSHATAHRPSSTMSNAEDVKSEDSKADPNIVSIKVRGQVR